MPRTCMLADIPNFGRVYDCGECGGIHVSIGAFSVTLSPDAYMQLVALVHTSAANFEVWLQTQRDGVADRMNENSSSDGTPGTIN